MSKFKFTNRYRIVRKPMGTYWLEVKRWWLPIWVLHDWYTCENDALFAHGILINPVVKYL